MNSKKEKFGWRCGYERIYGSFHVDNERCDCKGHKLFESKEDAIRSSLNHSHSDSVYVYSNKTGYVGCSRGLLFNIV